LVSCPVELIDERLTTSSASASLSQAGINAKDQRKKIDSQSAVIILESGLAKDRE
jgi:putative Holliday junction resolvase